MAQELEPFTDLINITYVKVKAGRQTCATVEPCQHNSEAFKVTYNTDDVN